MPQQDDWLYKKPSEVGLLSPPKQTSVPGLGTQPLIAPVQKKQEFDLGEFSPLEKFGHGLGRVGEGLFIRPFEALTGALGEASKFRENTRGITLPIPAVALASLIPSKNYKKWTGDIHDFGQKIFPSKPELQGDFWWDTAPQFVGDLGAYIGAGVIGTAIAGPAGGVALAATLGGAQGITEQRSRLQPFVDNGELSEEAANRASLVGVVPGVLQAYTPFKLVGKVMGKSVEKQVFKVLEKGLLSKPGLKYLGKEGLEGGFNEVLTESVGVIGQNAIERVVVNKDRKWYDGVGEAAGAGGGAGFVLSVITTAVGLKVRGRLPEQASTKKIGEMIMIHMALEQGVISETEAKLVETQPDLLYKLAQARFDDNTAKLKARTTENGLEFYDVEVKPDNVTWQEKLALQNNETVIESLRAARLKGETVDIFKTSENGISKELVFPETRRKGYLIRASKLTDDLSLRNRIANAQKEFIQKFRTVRKLNIDDNSKTALALRLDVEFSEKIERMLKNSDDSETSTRSEMVKEVTESSIKPENQPPLIAAIQEIIDGAIKRKPLAKQREIIEEIIATSTNADVTAVARQVHRKMLTDFRRRPWSERVGMGIAKIGSMRKALEDPAFMKSYLARQKEIRKNLVDLVYSLPPERRGRLRRTVLLADTSAKYGKAVQEVHDAQVKYIRDISISKISKSIKRARKNTRKKEVLETLRKFLDEGVGSPEIIKSNKTGSTVVGIKELKSYLKDLDPDHLRSLAEQLESLVRQGRLEKGLYDKARKIQSETDVRESLLSLKDHKEQSDFVKRTGVLRHVTRLVIDPTSVEAWLYQISKGDINHPLYKVLHEDFVQPMMEHYQDSANIRRYWRGKSNEILGIDSQSFKYVKYMKEKLDNGISRGAAMWAYALEGDPGRKELLRKSGIEENGNKFDVDETLNSLSEKDKEFVDETKKFFESQDFIEKAYSNHLYLHGYEAERNPGWFTSRRTVEASRLANLVDEKGQMIDDLGAQVIKDTHALKARTEDTTHTFKLDGGYAAAFISVSDRLSLYGRTGLEIYRAGRLLTNPEFARQFKNRFGKSQYDTMSLYLQNVIGFLGHEPTQFDVAATYLTQAFVAGKIAGNVASALKQSLSILTALGDDILDSGAIMKSLLSGAGFDKGVGKRMRDASGFAYLRLHHKFGEQLMVLGDQKISTKLAWAQEKSFVLQKLVDDWSLRVTWKAAELMAEKRGLKGQEAKTFVRYHFEKSLMRNQASNSPLYASTMEMYAKKQPVLRPAIALMRELNRLYNVPRRHVVRAIQAPSQENILKAGNALLFVVIANSVIEQLINEGRRALYGLPFDDEKTGKQLIGGLASRWYLLGDGVSFALEEMSNNPYASERLHSPIVSTAVDAFTSGKALYKAAVAGASDLDEDRFIQRGPSRGQSRVDVELVKSFDNALSATSNLTGLPFWALWSQGKGLYNWKRDDYRLMVHLEAERVRLEDKGEEDGFRYREIQRLKSRINNVHHLRERGLYDAREAREEIINLLKDDQESQ